MLNTCKELISKLDPRRDFDRLDFGNPDDLMSRGVHVSIKIVTRGGVAGALLGTGITLLTGEKIDGNLVFNGALAGMAIDSIQHCTRLFAHMISTCKRR